MVSATFSGSVTAAEMRKWLEDSRTKLASASGKFQILVDMRGLLPLLPDAQTALEEGQKLFKAKGMERSCVILDSAVITMQFKRMAKETGIDAFERYIDASAHPDFITRAMDWLVKGKDPGK